MNIYLPLIGVILKVKGKGNFQKGKNYIVVCNHTSFMDVPVTTPFIPGPSKTIAKKELSKIPIFGTIYTLGSVLVDRKSEESRKNSFLQMKKMLTAGLHMCIFPEGTRNKSSQPLATFYDGAFRLAVDTKKAIIPAVIVGTKRVLPPNKTFYCMPGIVKLHFLPSVDAGDDNISLKEQVFEIMWQYCKKIK